MPQLREVQARPGYRLWLRYEDGAQGEVDLAHLVGRGVFAVWADEAAFRRVTLGQQGQPRWDDDLDLCPDSLYLALTGREAAELFPSLAPAASHA